MAIIFHEGSLGPKELRLKRILDFFGVPCKEVDVSEIDGREPPSLDYAAIGSIVAIAAVLNQLGRSTLQFRRPSAVYAYANERQDVSLKALQSLFAGARISFQPLPAGEYSLGIDGDLTDIPGPMAGLTFPSGLKDELAILIDAGVERGVENIISAGGAPVFIRFHHCGIPAYFCTNSKIVDIDEPVTRSYYDIKDHFCSAAPLVMFIRFNFQEVAWRPQELGGCLIIDDPLLRSKYGYCDFENLRDLMRQHGFTTNIAFIPWNWRRTRRGASDFFRDAAGLFSVSIHGCDHTAGEFGTRSVELLGAKARLAQSRMRNHQARTGIQHDPIMVFPQGIFSSACPGVLNRNGFLAAVNTEIAPVGSDSACTRIRDVWDVAIMAYGSFPIFTRRYAFHGLENFAFDLLLGKPCFIVAHHDYFRDNGAGLIDLVEKIGSLNCSLHWRPLGEVIRRSCRRRSNGAGSEEVEMYSGELIVANPLNQTTEVNIAKRVGTEQIISEIFCDGNPVAWSSEDGRIIISERIAPHSEKHFRVLYREQTPSETDDRSLSFELSVATRRILSEFRDDYVSRSRFLSASTEKLRRVLKRANRN
jgi:hypothetical protein